MLWISYLLPHMSKNAKGREYEPREFPGFDETVALQAIRNGWRSKLDLAFDKKRKREGW